MQRNASTSFSAFSPLALNVRACAGIMDEREMLDAIQEELRLIHEVLDPEQIFIPKVKKG